MIMLTDLLLSPRHLNSISGVRESMGMNQNIILYHDTDPNQTMALRACIVSGMQTRSGASGEWRKEEQWQWPVFELERARGPVAHILAPGPIVSKFSEPIVSKFSGPGGLTEKKEGVFQSFFFASRLF